MSGTAPLQSLTPPAVEITGLRFRWRADQPWVLDLAAFTLAAGERLFLAGPSGSGKSTLLALIAGVSLPNQGHVAVLGQAVNALSSAARDRFRADHLGVIFQMFNLLPYLSVRDNVTLPCRFSARRRSRAVAAAGSVAAEAQRLLAHLGMNEPALIHSSAAELSVGQQQRVAAARALIGGPDLILADEPTSALDTDRRQDFIELLLQECASAGTALLLVSHDRTLVGHFDRTAELPALNTAPPGA